MYVTWESDLEWWVCSPPSSFPSCGSGKNVPRLASWSWGVSIKRAENGGRVLMCRGASYVFTRPGMSEPVTSGKGAGTASFSVNDCQLKQAACDCGGQCPGRLPPRNTASHSRRTRR